MKNLFILICLALICQGCGTIINKIPENSFQELRWERSAWGTSGLIEAKNGTVKDGILSVETVHVKQVNPGFNLEFTVTGYERKVSE